MPEPKDPGKLPRFFDLERDPSRAEVTRPASILRSTEWGGMTFVAVLAALAFPPYFFQVLWLAFLNAGGLLWVIHLSERGRDRLREFEREFSKGHLLEEKGRFAEAAKAYEALVPAYQDMPKISAIATHRIEWLRKEHPSAFAESRKKAPRSRKPK